eukprot:m.63343 g.63343  ORF g.63343 m.63343 type:complete len:675 (-) comp23270_c0_seq1:50-2074(-)
MSPIYCTVVTSVLLGFLVDVSSTYPLPLQGAGNVVNVQDFGAKGDGMHDDTAALLTAIAHVRSMVKDPSSPYPAPHYDIRVLYFPNGDYLVSDTLQLYVNVTEYTNGTVIPPYFYRISLMLIVMGESTHGVTIHLADRAPGFQSITEAKPVFLTFPGSHHNDGQWMCYQDLTINTGSENPGAVGLDHIANNVNGVSNLVITSADGNGLLGLNFTRELGGQIYFSNIRISGFQTGFALGSGLMTAALENITIDNATVGINVTDKMAQIRGLTTSKTVSQPVVMLGAASVIVIDSTLDGDGSSPSINNVACAQLYVRNVQVPSTHTQPAIMDCGSKVNGPLVKEHSHFSPLSNFDGSPTTSTFLTTPIRSVPNTEDIADTVWTVFNLDTVSFKNATQIIQAVIDSGVENLYLGGSYPGPIHDVGVDQLVLRGNLRRFHGGWHTIGSARFKNTPAGAMCLRVDSMNHTDPVVIQALSICGIHQNATNEVIIRHVGCQHPAATCYMNTPAVVTGDVFFEAFDGGGSVVSGGNVSKFGVGPTFSISRPGRVWARAMDVEGTQRHVHVEGGSLWVLGSKLGELQGIPTFYAEGGRVEMLGGVFNGGMAVGYPTVVLNNTATSFVGWTERFFMKTSKNIFNETYLGQTKGMLASEFPSRSIVIQNGTEIGNHLAFYRSKSL